LLGHLLGTHQSHASAAHHVAIAGSGSNNPFLVNSLDTLKGVRWSDVFKGLEVPRSVIVGTIIGAMFLWLCAIYWVRHHESIANQAIGVGTVQAAPNLEDRRLMDSVNRAMPIPTQARLESQGTVLNTVPAPQASQAPNQSARIYTNTGAGSSQAAAGSARLYYSGQADLQNTNAYHLPSAQAGVKRLRTVVTR
jgi:hypothetical protein